MIEKVTDRYEFRFDNVILLGDTHDLAQNRKSLIKVPKDCDLIHLGDVGLGFGPQPSCVNHTLAWLNTYNEICAKKNIHFYLLRGNHDATYDQIWNEKFSNVFLIKHFAYGTFPNGKKALFVGGGISLDRCVRRENIDYWPDEATPELENVEECDFVFSHDAPEHFNHCTASLPRSFGWYVERDVTLISECYKQRYNISSIVERSKAKQIFGGHFHNTLSQEIDGVKYRSLSIHELYEFDSTR